ncbi:MAG: thioredoxin [Hyphomicrobiales bacterium]|nr:thioredoxin [Hyphomicrobiales bacterium]MDE2113372.1 thioredoxin [Hyphomicrobiales bacterium]
MNIAPKATVATKATTAAEFRADVLTESARQPVLVDFWAPWCGPCKQLTPIIERVVKAADGKVKLVTMNIDEHPQIAGQLGIQSIPAVIAFQRGQPVDGFVGALPESQIRGFIERLVGPLASANADLLVEAAALYKAGELDAAAALYGEVLADEPDLAAALAGLARIHLDKGEMDQAKAVLAGATAKAAKDPEIVAVQALIDIAGQAAHVGDSQVLEQEVARNPLNHQARFDLALALNGEGKRDQAADALLEIIKVNRKWEEDGARKQLVQFFEAWGPMDEATLTARRKLSSLLFA